MVFWFETPCSDVASKSSILQLESSLPWKLSHFCGHECMIHLLSGMKPVFTDPTQHTVSLLPLLRGTLKPPFHEEFASIIGFSAFELCAF
jgi:hypothetical protein